jgi:predicted lipoprotein with Yx(FWY)xxD motif
LLASKRILAVIVGVPALVVAMAACATQNRGGGADPYGGTGDVAVTGSPAPIKPPVELGAGAGSLQAPVGIQTDKLIGLSIPKMGEVVTDAKGWILYRFDKDTAKPASTSACSGQCAVVWPPVLTDGNPQVEGIARSAVGTLIRDDGATQLTVGGWPVYRYVGDTKPGQWKGQMVSGTWFVVAPDGKKNLSCLPTTTPTPAQPPAANAAPPAGGGSGGY